MSKSELIAMPMTLREKSTGRIWKSDGKFHTITADWNCDGDVYTDRIMTLYELDGNAYRRIHADEFNDDYKIIKGW